LSRSARETASPPQLLLLLLLLLSAKKEEGEKEEEGDDGTRSWHGRGAEDMDGTLVVVVAVVGLPSLAKSTAGFGRATAAARRDSEAATTGPRTHIS
jgi:hypothetical protein